VSFEYVMIAGVNDQPEHAHQLSALLSSFNTHINLIPLNSTAHFKGQAPEQVVMKEFGRILLDHGITLTFRESQGSEISAGCGQLAAKNQ
jgi:23S rRNA (adenine2503-C2)-methyltransferase